jgi:membrane protein
MAADLSAPGGARAATDAVLHRLPPWLQRWVSKALDAWPGRILIDTIANFVRIETFDRSMTLAAQFFSSVLPIVILLATWGDPRDFADALDMPEESRSVVEQAVQGAEGAAFGVVGALVVLASATSLSRALTRAFAAIWRLPRPRARLGSAWRWVAVILVLALSLVVVRAVAAPMSVLPPREVWPVVASFILDVTVSVFVPWVLLSGDLRARLLVPGAVIFALVMLAVRPATQVWLERALEVSADRYGSIGVAFTYLTWLYVLSFCFLTAGVLGQTIATDRGKFGGWIRQQSRSRAVGDDHETGSAHDGSGREETRHA